MVTDEQMETYEGETCKQCNKGIFKIERDTCTCAVLGHLAPCSHCTTDFWLECTNCGEVIEGDE